MWCRKCRMRVGLLDAPNHDFNEHMSEEEREAARAEIKAKAEERERKRAKMTPTEEAEFWNNLKKGE